jgi:TPR repeat protein
VGKKPTNAKEQYEIEQLTLKAEQGDADAMYKLGSAYESRHFDNGGASTGVRFWIEFVLHCLCPTLITSKDLKSAIYWYAGAVEKFTVAANNGDADAQYKLYEVLERQYHLFVAYRFTTLPKLKREARSWLIKAANNDHVEAQSTLKRVANDPLP